MKKTDIGSLGDDAEDEHRHAARLVAAWNSGPATDLGTSCVIEHISVCLCHCSQQQATRCCLKLLSWSFYLLCMTNKKKQHCRQWKAAIPPEAEVPVRVEAQERHWAQVHKQRIRARPVVFFSHCTQCEMGHYFQTAQENLLS